MDPSPERPVIRCIVGYEWPGGCTAASVAVTLEEAAILSRYGWSVLIDAFDVEELTRWEQIQRALGTRRPWGR